MSILSGPRSFKLTMRVDIGLGLALGGGFSMQHVDLMLRNVLVYLPAPGRCWPAMHSQSS